MTIYPSAAPPPTASFARLPQKSDAEAVCGKPLLRKAAALFRPESRPHGLGIPCRILSDWQASASVEQGVFLLSIVHRP